MKARPILFNAEMVRALIDGRKTQTRRVMKHQPAHGCRYDMVESKVGACHWNGKGIFVPYSATASTHVQPCPYGQPGDLLWVRERISIDDAGNSGFCGRPYAWHVTYPADDHSEWVFSKTLIKTIGSKPSIHMPRWASRFTLRITDIRVERVQDISENDALAEGVSKGRVLSNSRNLFRTGIKGTLPPLKDGSAIGSFRDLWGSINAKRGFGWDANPWVWVVEFEVIKENVDQVIADERL